MSLKELQKFTFVSKYANYIPEKQRRESWSEAVHRSRDMMLRKYEGLGIDDEINSSYDMIESKRVLGSQRSLQFGGKAVESKNARMFNCWGSYVDRLRVFQECMYLLLCGGGVGFSVQKHHIEKLPKLKKNRGENKRFVIPDSIEGWSDSVGILVSSYFQQKELFPEYSGKTTTFDFTKIRPKGSPLSSGNGTAPGPEPLKKALKKIKGVLDNCLKEGMRQIRPIDAYDIIMHSSDAVIAGGVRRSASLALCSADDQEMIEAKNGNWFVDNPQRGRSNNSVMLLRDETSLEEYAKIFASIKEFGEPGTLWSDDRELCTNPCHRGGSKVKAPSGIRTFDDIKVGDMIWSDEGWTKITNKICTGEKDIYKYKTTAGFFEGTKEHRIVSDGEKVEIGKADSIDIIEGPKLTNPKIDLQTVVDGLVLGDGSRYTGTDKIILYIGENDQEYFDSNIESFIGKKYKGICGHRIQTTLTAEEVCHTYNRRVPERFMEAEPERVASFLRGMYTANGSVCHNRITLKTASPGIVEDVQCMLSSIGIRSYYTTNKPAKVKFRSGEYERKQSYDINITVDRETFVNTIGFIQQYKNDKIKIKNSKHKKSSYDIISIEHLGKEKVYDITVDNDSHTYWSQGCNVSNCVEIGFYCYDSKGNSGFQACNLSTINCGKVKTKEDFFECCRAAAIIGTLQAGFTDFDYMGSVTEEIVKREALIGVSMTGVMESHHICLDPKVQRAGAKIVKATNKEIAKKIGINQAARTTCVKPEGSASCLVGSSSGIHPHAAKRYIRHVQCNKDDVMYQYFAIYNDLACQESVWSVNNTDDVISFCVEVPDGSKLKNQTSAIELLTAVKDTQKNWVLEGKNEELCTQKWLSHNVSNTISVKDHEWDEVANFIYKNRQYFCGVSLISSRGDKDYQQAPFTTIYLPTEMVSEYGDGVMFASGLIEVALNLFEDNLWDACDSLLGKGKRISGSSKKDWIKRCKKFADKYMDGDVKKLTYCMKDIYNWKRWLDLNRVYKSVDYTKCIEVKDNTNFEGESACAGGKCEV